ncbi:NUDIX hydrolase [Roseibium denhamense]|uniref:GDP-mannose pyrophosphatase n=1 Tax=Roseibium denhamense TaxID=76305 RepID=A0ABY1NGY4_9HYPH|nr:NUDIX hydrolase [Roseibium denhamense]MTI06393.1 NUDIX hydrolase [Roseibium denhamense]SMP08821.1 ADP-ribose pyrophosphatase [Roseibium denhamense]
MELAKQQEPNTNWSLLSSEKVFEAGDRLKVLRQTVELPDLTRVEDYYQIDLPTYATIYAVTDQDEVLLLEQYKHGVGQVCLTLPGGQIDPGENPEFAARRELLEETGYGGGRWLAGPSLVLHGNQRVALGHIFVARHVIKLNDPSPGDLEDMQVKLQSRKDVQRSLIDGKLPITSHAAAVGIAETMIRAGSSS